MSVPQRYKLFLLFTLSHLYRSGSLSPRDKKNIPDVCFPGNLIHLLPSPWVVGWVVVPARCPNHLEAAVWHHDTRLCFCHPLMTSEELVGERLRWESCSHLHLEGDPEVSLLLSLLSQLRSASRTVESQFQEHKDYYGLSTSFAELDESIRQRS